VRQFIDNSLNNPSTNADNYRVYAQELFWTELCGKQFGDATDNSPYPHLTNPTPETKPPPPPTGLIKAVTIIYQSNVGKKDVHWVIYPGNHLESKLCADGKDAYMFPTHDAPDDNFIMPFPQSTFLMKDVFGRSAITRTMQGRGCCGARSRMGSGLVFSARRIRGKR
jgi:hypothetical protein